MKNIFPFLLLILFISQCNTVNTSKKDKIEEENLLLNKKLKDTVQISSKEREVKSAIVNLKGFSKDSSFLEVVKELNIPKEKIYIDFVSKKQLLFEPNKTVIVIPLKDTYEDEDQVYMSSLYVLLLNNETNTILGTYHQKENEAILGEIEIKNINILDTQIFKIHDHNFSFGIETEIDGVSIGKSLTIFNLADKKLLKVHDITISDTEIAGRTIEDDENGIPYNPYTANFSITDTKTNNYYDIEVKAKYVYYFPNEYVKNNLKKTITESSYLLKFNSEINSYEKIKINSNKEDFLFKNKEDKAVLLSNFLSVKGHDDYLNYDFKEAEGIIVNVSKVSDLMKLSKETCDWFSYVYINSHPIYGWVSGHHIYKINEEYITTFDYDEKSYFLFTTSNYAMGTEYEGDLVGCPVNSPIVLGVDYYESTLYHGLIHMDFNELYPEESYPYFELKNDDGATDKIQETKKTEEGNAIELTILRTYQEGGAILNVVLYEKIFSSKDVKYFATITSKKELTEEELQQIKNNN